MSVATRVSRYDQVVLTCTKNKFVLERVKRTSTSTRHDISQNYGVVRVRGCTRTRSYKEAWLQL